MITIRFYQKSDFNVAKELFYQTVHAVCIADYPQSILSQWAPIESDQEALRLSLENSFSYVAEKDGIIVGFGNIDSQGSIDYLFVHKDCQGVGIGTLIIKTIEAKAIQIGLAVITTEASLTAQPFFERHNFEYIETINEENSIFKRMQKIIIK